MSKIKINQLNNNAEQSAEMIDLRGDSTTKNSVEFTAFTTLRGGLAVAKPCWCCNLL
ncbi:MAG: hypothetical protein V7K40_17235 [Nostoc sp.]|uniref:hypothetical protein n=1 Tax=Nostoc sp. TaxID=1180 RepID=UPI002FF8FABB